MRIDITGSEDAVARAAIIDQAETETGLSMPPSFRAVLLRDDETWNNMAFDTQLIERARFPSLDRPYLCVLCTGTGDYYAFVGDDDGCASKLYFADHETGEISFKSCLRDQAEAGDL